MAEQEAQPVASELAFLSGGGIAGATARAVDWSKTAAGPVERWPASLKTIVATMLNTRHPMFLWWGPELVQFYNDGYLPSFGRGRHPAAMGQRGADCWQEIWPLIWPQIHDVMAHAKPSWNVDQLVPIARNGRIEEVYWTYGYSPVFVESGAVGGTLVVCTETTHRVLSDRRQRSLRILLERAPLAESPRALLETALQTFEAAPHDLPFALAYEPGPDSKPRLAGYVGVAEDALPLLDAAVQRRRTQGAGALELGFDVRAGPWPEPVRSAFVQPVGSGAATRFLVFGLSPRLPFDAAYLDYLRQLADSFERAQASLETSRLRAAAESERRNLLLQAPVATALFTGPQHVFEVANPLYCELVGRANLVGKTYREAFPELAQTALPGILDRVYQTGEPFVSNEYLAPIDRGTGRIEDRYFRFNLQPIRDVAGAVYGMMAVAIDITEQVEARRTLETAQIERERLLVELESANRRKDEFLALLGHELRNPLAPIATAVQLMKLRGDLPAERERQVIERQVGHISRLVDDLLDVSRIATGKIELRQRPVEVAEVLVKAIEMASPLLEQRSHQLSVHVPREGLMVSGDPIRLAQIFSNLLTNAAKYTPPNGHIEVTARRDDEQVEVSVKDDGVGIAPGLLQNIFGLFVQGPRSFDRGEGGLGLGLSLVKSLAALHGGTVEARSEGEGRGSAFIVRLPLGLGAPVAEPAPAPRPEPHRGKRVLVVDDNIDAAELLSEALRMKGHEVEVAHDGAEALLKLGSFDAEVGVLDLGLPVMDGFELARRVRELGRSPAVRLVALTGYGQEHDVRRSREAGFEKHLVKPVTLDEVASAVEGSG